MKIINCRCCLAHSTSFWWCSFIYPYTERHCRIHGCYRISLLTRPGMAAVVPEVVPTPECPRQIPHVKRLHGYISRLLLKVILGLLDLVSVDLVVLLWVLWWSRGAMPNAISTMFEGVCPACVSLNVSQHIKFPWQSRVLVSFLLSLSWLHNPEVSLNPAYIQCVSMYRSSELLIKRLRLLKMPALSLPVTFGSIGLIKGNDAWCLFGSSSAW